MSNYAAHIIKKEREQFQLKAFKECFGEISAAEISILDNDPPDGVIRINGKNISVELTQIFWDSDTNGLNKKAQESLADIIMDLAERKYTKLGMTPVQVNVSFIDKYGLDKYGNPNRLNSSDKERLSDYIVAKVIEYIPLEENELFEVPMYNANYERILDPKIESIYITQYSCLTENCWSADGGGTIPPITVDKICNAIDKKNKDLYRYKAVYNESWLVVIEDWTGISGYFSFLNSEELRKEKFKSPFNRIFILRGKRREVIELQVENVR